MRTVLLATLGGVAPVVLASTALYTYRAQRKIRLGWRKREERTPHSEVVQLITETEAFLSGDILHHLQCRGDTVPGWAWANAFAHGDLHHIRRVRRACAEQTAALHNVETWTVPDPPEESWRAARVKEEPWRSAQRVLANELLDLVGDDHELLGYLQQRALVPVELHLMERESQAGSTPFDLVQSTRSALRSIMS